MARIALIDGDVLAYREAASSQKTFLWAEDGEDECPDPSVALDDLDDVKEGVAEKIEEWRIAAGAKEVMVALGDSVNNWRKLILPTYKGNRDPAKRPLLLKELRAWITSRYPAPSYPWLEGDDILGMLSTGGYTGKHTPVVVSVDKDMRTLPGVLIYDPLKEKFHRTTRDDAVRYHLEQTLSGDVTDGYGGCPQIGKVRASKLLAGLTSVDDMWTVVLETYAKKGLDAAYALTQARVAHIMWHGEYRGGSIQLWGPPGLVEYLKV